MIHLTDWIGGKMIEPESPNDPVARAGMGVGQLLIISGLILVYGVGGYWLIFEISQDPKTPWFVKFGAPAIVVGLTILFLTVLAQRIKAAKTDKYTNVED